MAIIQARMGSTRLPGKVMRDIAGKPLLARVIERVSAIPGVACVVIATTTAERDRLLLDVARDYGVEAYAGSENDVLDRYYQAARTFSATTIVRITADCPLLDPEVSHEVLRHYERSRADYVSNTNPPTYPDGLDTEVFSFNALERAWNEARMTSEREHVTPYIWKRPDRFSVANVRNLRDLSALRWTVDEPEDLEFVRLVYAYLGRNGRIFGMDEVLGLLGEHPEIQVINSGFVRNEGYAKSVREDRITK